MGFLLAGFVLTDNSTRDLPRLESVLGRHQWQQSVKIGLQMVTVVSRNGSSLHGGWARLCWSFCSFSSVEFS